MDQTVSCSVCGKGFEPRFRFQVSGEEGRPVFFCSQACRAEHLSAAVTCRSCGTRFTVEFPYQVVARRGEQHYYCSMACRGQRAARREPRVIAVFNHKGGTGKTTTSVNIAAALAEAGRRVLLIDADGQGNVGASLGIRGERTLYDVIVSGTDANAASVPVRNNLDVLTSNETLAAAELYLASRPARHRVLRQRLSDRASSYDYVIVDCAPALSLMNQNVLVCANAVLVPVSCDYLSLIGVKQVLRTLSQVRDSLGHRVELFGVLPTFFDVRNKIAKEALDALVEGFGERCLPPVRVNTRLREAPRARQTIFEYAPNSSGASDYLELAQRILAAPIAEATTPRAVAS
ncbi:MAG: ParA family protein [Myxococcota bacterium]